MNDATETQLITRAAWLYYIVGFNQEATALRMGLTRARVNKLLQQARETGIVSITVNDRDIGLLPIEEKLRQSFGLEFCITTPALGAESEELAESEATRDFAFRAVGAAAAKYLRGHLANNPNAIVGTGWGRTLAHLSRQMAGVKAPGAHFVSLMGSLTANSAFNPFEVVQALAQATGGEGYFLPVPFIADSPEDRDVLLAQWVVARPLELARDTDLALISVGELTEQSLLRRSDMITAEQLHELREVGAVGDSNGVFFDASGAAVDHDLNRRSIGVGLTDLAKAKTVLLSAGSFKSTATEALLRSGTITGLIIDGDSALALCEGNNQDTFARSIA